MIKLNDIRIGTRIFGLIGLIFIFVVGIDFVSRSSVKRVMESMGWVNHTHDVIAQVDQFMKYMVDMETGQRGYLLSGDETFLQPFSVAQEHVQQTLDDVIAQVSDNPEQVKRFRKAELLKNQWIQSAQKSDEIWKESTGEQSGISKNALVKEQLCAKQIMDSIRVIIDEITEVERELLEVRTNQNRADALRASRAISITIACVILVGIILGTIIVRNLVRSIQTAYTFSEEVTHGDYTKSFTVDQKDEIGLLINNIHRMTQQLKAAAIENQQQKWHSDGLTQLNDLLRDEHDSTRVSNAVCSFFADYVDGQIVTMYLREGEKLLLKGSYAFSKHKALGTEIQIGEGFVGQAAVENKLISITEIPADYTRINSSTGDSVPTNLVVIPTLYENEVNGVIEVASFRELSDEKLRFMDASREQIGIALQNISARILLEEALSKTQEQQEELRQSNEELEEQTKSLQESEERLRVQQEELEETNTNLEERTDSLEKQRAQVKQQNEELTNARDRIAEKAQELEITSKYKSEFLANMSHELRTPLNSMLILSKMLADNKKKHLDAKEAEFAKTINNSGTSLLTLINEILDLSKIESGKIELEIQDMKIQGFLSDLKQVFEPIANEKKLDFKVDMADNVPTSIRTDEQRLGQIIKNLLSNALKFTTKGSVTISIDHPVDGVISEPPTPRPLQIRVTDTGVGIPKDKQRLIFEAFQQADGSTSRKFGGTGLGLSISRELAKLLGGEIRIESTPGEGSTFILLIPLESVLPKKNDLVCATPSSTPAKPAPVTIKKAEPIAPPPVASTAGDNDDRENVSSGDRSILIVEDDETFASVMLELVREKEFKGIVAPTGEEGLRLALEHKPSAILMDIGLPGMDGLAVLDRLKEDIDLRHIPIHMISGHDKELDSFRRGAAGFLRKPISTEQLDTLMFDPIERIISGETRRLLLVEDDPTSRMSIEALLIEKDIEIIQAGSGKKALELLASESFDCMVLDLGLPDMSGMDVLEKIKEINTIGHVPVVVFTGRDLTSKEQGTLDSYAERIVVKGVKSQERLLDETALFLHRVEADLPEEKKKMIRMLHDKETIFRDKKILVVDDDMRNIFALSSVLEEKGMVPFVAKNGQEALDMLKKTKGIDLILMDIMMPVMDGYEAMRNIRDLKSNIKYSNIPIIALTAKAMKGDRFKCIEAGANDYIAKPVDLVKLFSVMRVWLYQ